MKNMSMTVNSPFLDENKYFIHFDSPGELKRFLKSKAFHVGYLCCDGKGAHLIGVNSYTEINRLKRDFYKSSNTSISSANFECPVCLETKKMHKKYRMNCSHNICCSCINGMKQTYNMNNNCPMCRVPFD